MEREQKKADQKRTDRRKEQKRIRYKRQSELCLRMGRIFLVILGVFLLVNIIKPKKEFSASENRMLAKRPQLTWESVKSGKYMSEFESYVSDQFFLRNQWISLKFYEDKFLGKRESNGVFLGKKGYLMEKPADPDWKNVERNMKAISEFAGRHSEIPVYMALVPNAAYILKDKMPANAPVRDQLNDIEKVEKMAGDSVKSIDMADVMKKHASEEIYYKTDHHWTSLGAYYGFEKIAKDMKIEGLETEYNVHIVSGNFQGTLASKSGYHGSMDAVSVYEPKNLKTDYIVLYTEEGKKSTSIYDSKSLKEKDKYTVFFGGNHARIDISTTQTSRKNLLLFKDSYANCMVQFLLPYYQNIIVVDPRYFYDSVDSIIDSYGITDVLFLYNVDTFLGDNSIADVLIQEEPEEDAEALEESQENGTEGAQDEGSEDDPTEDQGEGLADNPADDRGGDPEGNQNGAQMDDDQ